MADDDKIDVIITFDPENPKRNETTESLPRGEALKLLDTGRARLPEKSAGKKSEKPNTLS